MATTAKNNNTVTIDLTLYDELKDQIAALSEENALSLNAINELEEDGQKVLVLREVHTAIFGKTKLIKKRVLKAVNLDDVKEELKEHYQEELSQLEDKLKEKEDKVKKLEEEIQVKIEEVLELHHKNFQLRHRSLWQRILNKQ